MGGIDMKLYAPKYYSDFRCIADKCTHSCCIGWEIDIDEDSLDKYAALKGNYASTIKQSIDREGTAHFRLSADERCPHLDKSGLCKIITEFGDGYLCDICREHPRFYNQTARGLEVGLGMACEEACRIILSSGNYDCITEIGTSKSDRKTGIFDTVSHRDAIYGILADTSLRHADKLIKIYREYGVSPAVLKDGEWRAVLFSLEYLDQTHADLFSCFSTDVTTPAELEAPLERALAYFIYRHCSGAECEEELFASLGFCLFCERLLASVLKCGGQDIIRTARIISEELEYSEDNTDTIKAEFLFL